MPSHLFEVIMKVKIMPSKTMNYAHRNKPAKPHVLLVKGCEKWIDKELAERVVELDGGEIVQEIESKNIDPESKEGDGKKVNPESKEGPKAKSNKVSPNPKSQGTKRKPGQTK